MKLFDKFFRRQRPQRAGQRVAIRAGSVVTEVGAASILHGLFSSISANLEPGGWGTRFPIAMNRLYQGSVPADEAAGALAELRIVERELGGLPVSRLVWDHEDRAAAPSRHYRAPADASSLADFFVTVNGLNLLRAGLIESLESAVEFGHDVRIVSFDTPRDLFEGRDP